MLSQIIRRIGRLEAIRVPRRKKTGSMSKRPIVVPPAPCNSPPCSRRSAILTSRREALFLHNTWENEMTRQLLVGGLMLIALGSVALAGDKTEPLIH
jgi:hypothetical protein